MQSCVGQSQRKEANNAKDCGEKVRNINGLKDRQDEVLEAPELYHKICDGHLGQILRVELSIYLELAAKPYRSVSYHACIRMRDIKKTEVGMMVEQG